LKNIEEELFSLLQEKERRKKYNKIKDFFPDKGEFRRELYKKHLYFFEAGKLYQERALIAANRVGKSVTSMCELSYHLTGLYPDWWKGHVFDEPIDSWAAGKTSETTRDILQELLLGKAGELGTGLIPGGLIIGDPTRKIGVPNAYADVFIRHKSGGRSFLGFKSYIQGFESFQGTVKHVICLDEECPMDIYAECLLRTMTVSGLMLCTFTPLLGMSHLVKDFFKANKAFKEGRQVNKFMIQLTWDDAPHLSEHEKKRLLESIPPYQRKARSKGIPQLGSGVIYPIDEEDIKVKPFEIPHYWPRGYGLDVGWNRTAAIWGAWDRENNIWYLYREYYMGQEKPVVHAAAINSPDKWIPGCIDPKSDNVSSKDGQSLLAEYTGVLELDLIPADNTVEAGILRTYNMLSTSRLKIFNTCQIWFEEQRIYRRDHNGKIVKDDDHLMDATRYLMMTGPDIAITEPVEDDYYDKVIGKQGRSDVGGY